MSENDLSKRIREMIQKAERQATDSVVEAVRDVLPRLARVVLTAKCRACGQKNRWTAGRIARCGKCGFPLPEAPVQ